MYPHAVLRRRRRVDRVTFANLVSEPENFAAWSASGTPVVTGGQPDPFGGTDAFLLEDNNLVGVSQLDIGVSFASDGAKGFSLFVKEAPSSDRTVITLRDETAGTQDGVVVIWMSGAPLIDGGTATFLGFRQYSDGWWRALIQGPVVAANVNLYRIVPATGGAASTGNIFVFGATAHNEPTPGAYERA